MLNTTMYYVDKEKLIPSDLFKEYVSYESYDPDKSYDENVFNHDFGNGLFSYKNTLHIINETNRWIVCEEVLNNIEQTELIPYCQCLVCTTSYFNINKMSMCPCCYGCIASIRNNQQNINATRLYKKQCEESNLSNIVHMVSRIFT